MAEDAREAIMSRLLVLLAGIPEVNVARNQIILGDVDRDQISLLEGSEEASDREPVNLPADAPLVIYMYPQIVLSVFAAASEIGPKLSNLRGKIIKAITTDTTLTDLTVKSRGISYGRNTRIKIGTSFSIRPVGLSTELAVGQATWGQMFLNFKFAYVLRLDELA
jgi:hypothetical protein